MKPVVYNENAHTIKNRSIAGNAQRVIRTLQRAGYEAYLVGGGVRDLLLGDRPKDFDIVTNAKPEEIKGLFRRSRIIGRRFRLVHVLFGREMIEVATFRAGDQEESSRFQTNDSGFLVRDNIYGSIDQDAFRRDFTINALYYDPSKNVIVDYCDGYDHLKAEEIRLIGDPAERFVEDPVRILRAVRFEAKLGFEIDKALLAPMQEHAHLLGLVSSSRMYEEVIKFFLTGHGVQSYYSLMRHGFFQSLFPGNYEALKEQGFPEGHLLLASLDNSDMRHHQGQSSSPYFLYASLLWEDFKRRLAEYEKAGERGNAALKKASDQVFREQGKITAFPRYVREFIVDLWFYQSRLTVEVLPKDLERIMRHKRFKAAYDFLLLRAVAEESDFIIQRANFWRHEWTKFEKEMTTN